MNPRQQAHEERLIRRFIVQHRAKYEKGTQEHSGCLEDVPILELVKYAKEEVLDQWSYLDTLEERLKELAAIPELSDFLTQLRVPSDIPDFPAPEQTQDS